VYPFLLAQVEILVLQCNRLLALPRMQPATAQVRHICRLCVCVCVCVCGARVVVVVVVCRYPVVEGA
jgi:hypothetical protein